MLSYMVIHYLVLPYIVLCSFNKQDIVCLERFLLENMIIFEAEMIVKVLFRLSRHNSLVVYCGSLFANLEIIRVLS